MRADFFSRKIIVVYFHFMHTIFRYSPKRTSFSTSNDTLCIVFFALFSRWLVENEKIKNLCIHYECLCCFCSTILSFLLCSAYTHLGLRITFSDPASISKVLKPLLSRRTKLNQSLINLTRFQMPLKALLGFKSSPLN